MAASCLCRSLERHWDLCLQGNVDVRLLGENITKCIMSGNCLEWNVLWKLSEAVVLVCMRLNICKASYAIIDAYVKWVDAALVESGAGGTQWQSVVHRGFMVLFVVCDVMHVNDDRCHKIGGVTATQNMKKLLIEMYPRVMGLVARVVNVELNRISLVVRGAPSNTGGISPSDLRRKLMSMDGGVHRETLRVVRVWTEVGSSSLRSVVVDESLQDLLKVVIVVDRDGRRNLQFGCRCVLRAASWCC